MSNFSVEIKLSAPKLVLYSRSVVYMLNHPDVMKRCQAEIDDVIGQHRAPSMKDKASMPYVEATLLETQRMTSIAPFGVGKLSKFQQF